MNHSMLRIQFFAVLVAALLACAASSPAADATRPSVLLVVADDLGYADLGCYGGEIDTPNLDGLASNGVRFSRFRATTMCTTSRVAMLSGMPFHRAGQGSYAHAVPLPIVLRSAGYRTLMTGKWHAGKPDPRSPELFDRSFGFLGGMSDNFVGGDDWFDGPKPFNDFGSDFIAVDAFADRAIEFMAESVDAQQPFFAYVAFNTPHHPCQARKKTVDKYRKRYLAGYDMIRERRLERQVALGLSAAGEDNAPAGDEVKPWRELPPQRQRIEADRMAAYAATVDELDQATGRMLRFLDDAGVADNTLVLFLSDNGGDYSNGSLRTHGQQIPWKPKNNPTSSNGWAWVKNTPFRSYKHSSYEGGLAVPLIARWPNGIRHKNGEVISAPCNVTDIYPTLLDIAETRRPDARDKQLAPLTGSSLVPLLAGAYERVAKPAFFWYRFSRAWVEDEWKAVSLYDGAWQLFNLAEDRAERIDLASAEPQKLAELTSRWREFASQSGAPFPEPNPTRDRQWGWHRLQMTCPDLVDARFQPNESPSGSDSALELRFSKPVDFSNTSGKPIQLFAASDERTPVWQIDPEAGHPSQGKRVVRLTGLPELEPDRHYFVMWSSGAMRVGGKPVKALNDGAFWWRFRTPAKSDPLAQAAPPAGHGEASRGQTAPQDLKQSTWVGRSSSGRVLPMRSQCGPPRKDRYVAMFYFVWLGEHSKTGPHDITRITSAGPRRPDWGPIDAFHHWGEPEIGYYLSRDPYVHRLHASMLVDAGVDTIVIDVTNGLTYDQVVLALCETWSQMRREGNQTPQIAFLTHSNTERVVKRLNSTFYQRSEHKPLWFRWRGKPLLLANPEEVPPDARDFFTIRESWAWSHAPWFGDGRNKWAWIDDSPQEPGWTTKGKAEQVSVSAAGHPTRNLGRSHRRGEQPVGRRLKTDRGIYFREQFEHARKLDPELIFVTGWNEWVAQRFVAGTGKAHGKKFVGKPLKEGETYFVDQYNQEFSRDIEPMRGGHGDNYYKQLIAEVRRYKGAHRMPSGRDGQGISIDGQFDDWSDIPANYLDTIGDPARQDHPGWGTTGQLSNLSGRNDFVSAKVAHSDERVFFHIATRGPIQTDNQGAWMLLLVDVDQSQRTGWLGYDFVISPKSKDSREAAVYKLSTRNGKRQAKGLQTTTAGFGDSAIEIALPRELLESRGRLAFDFHWFDSSKPLTALRDLVLDGDSAPNRDFNYRYSGN